MPTTVIMPALELAQESGKVLRWMKSPGDTVTKGEPLVEIETDKVTVEIEAPASGTLYDVTAAEGEVVPVGHTIALIVGSGEAGADVPARTVESVRRIGDAAAAAAPAAAIKASPLARKLAEQHGVDLAHVQTSSGRIEKADILAHIEPAATRSAPRCRIAQGAAAGGRARRGHRAAPRFRPERRDPDGRHPVHRSLSPGGERARVRGPVDEASAPSGASWPSA